MSDIEFDEIDDEDFLQAINQLSQARSTSSRPAKRRRLSSHEDDNIENSDVDLPSAPRRRSSAKKKRRTLSFEEDGLAEEGEVEKMVKEPKKKKSKHLIHVPKVHREFEETFQYGTQAVDEDQGSSPYIARGARWKLAKPPPVVPEKQQVQPFAQKTAQTIETFFKPAALKEIPPNRKISNKPSPKSRSSELGGQAVSPVESQGASFPSLRNTASTRTAPSSGKAISTPASTVSSRSNALNPEEKGPEVYEIPSDTEDEYGSPIRITATPKPIPKTGSNTRTTGPSDADLAMELAEIGSDFFSSSPDEPEIIGQRLVAPQTNLRQTTLFGDKVSPAQVPASQVNMVRQYRVDTPPEPPTHHKIDLEAMKTWVYPTNLGQIRDYQYSIVKTGLFSNTLVALPTGLGKTFIAATIMLNFYRWTKDAQIVFMAPTKPLVTQQVNACFNVAGIPRSETVMLNGEVKKDLREEAWIEKRVFFCTPQTLENDLRSGLADPKRIVLMVIDEAHKAMGKYAYVKCIEIIRSFSKSFRVLALTATPGSTVEKVQEVMNNLEIAKVEIRTESSIDIQPYTHRRTIDEIVLQPSDEMNEISNLFSKALQPLVNILCAQKAYYNKDPMTLTPFGLMQAAREWTESPAGKNASPGLKNQLRAVVTILASIAHGIKLLKYHGLTPFYASIKEFREQVEEKGEKGSKYKQQVVNSGHFKEMMNYLQMWTANDDFVGSPKITVLCDTVLNHFMDAGEGTESAQSSTRVMIFSEFRDSAEVIVTELRKHMPMIKPSMFVGQSDSKRSVGMKQSKQGEVIADFKKGKFNVLVATSIGEEGLDIGEVDLIICYDTSASPIRMLQRMGRTGRKRAGRIVCLMMEGKEHENFAKAKDNYEKMQDIICKGTEFVFRTDLSTRIVPKGVIPEVDKRDVEIPFENSQDTSLPIPKARARNTVKKKTAKKFHMPDGVVTGFQKASKLAGGSSVVVAPKARKPRRTQKEIRRDQELTITEQTPIPSLDSVFLTPFQEKELERCYQSVGGSEWDQEVLPPDLTRFPKLQQSLRPTKGVGHSRATKDFVSALQKMDTVSTSTLNKWEHIRATNPATFMEDSDSEEEEEDDEDALGEDLIDHSMAVDSDDNAETDGEGSQTQKFTQSSGPHGSIALGSDTEGENSDDDLDEDLSGFVINDERSPGSSSKTASSPLAAAETAPQLKPFYQAVQFPATQDTDDELPDITAMRSRKGETITSSRTSTSAVAGARGRKSRAVFDDDSDE